jgi:hypothetical protein
VLAGLRNDVEAQGECGDVRHREAEEGGVVSVRGSYEAW